MLELNEREKLNERERHTHTGRERRRRGEGKARQGKDFFGGESSLWQKDLKNS